LIVNNATRVPLFYQTSELERARLVPSNHVGAGIWRVASGSGGSSKARGRGREAVAVGVAVVNINSLPTGFHEIHSVPTSYV